MELSLMTVLDKRIWSCVWTKRQYGRIKHYTISPWGYDAMAIDTYSKSNIWDYTFKFYLVPFGVAIIHLETTEMFVYSLVSWSRSWRNGKGRRLVTALEGYTQAFTRENTPFSRFLGQSDLLLWHSLRSDWLCRRARCVLPSWLRRTCLHLG